MTFYPGMFRGEKFIGTSELAKAAEARLRALGARQDRGTVSEIPDERTIRFYQSEGLLDPPIFKAGTASVFTIKHLLQLVAIKLLQSQDLPIKKIRIVIDGKSEDELEELIERSRESSHSDATSYLTAVKKKLESDKGIAGSSAERRDSSEGPSLMRTANRDEDQFFTKGPSISMRIISGGPPSAGSQPFKISRHEIFPGIQLRLDEKQIENLGDRELAEIIEKIRQLLNRFLE
jgi:DNA-binding transcriptional MerR regulator